jgi:quercetin dioxygenase-like cupin family protein
MQMTTTSTAPDRTLDANEGLKLQSGPGRDLIFKLTGEECGGALDYFTVEVGPHGGPPLHVHHRQLETIQVLSGHFKVRIGDEDFTLDERGFASLPAGVPHAFRNLTDEVGEIIVVYAPGGGRSFYEELGPATRQGTADRKQIAEIFERHDMTLLGPPLEA